MRGFLSQSPSPEPIFLFRKLVSKKFPMSNTFTLAFVLKCCSILPAFEEGKQVHKHVIASGEMQKGGVEPDEVTMVSVISACAMTGALGLGKWLHTFIGKKGIKNDLEVRFAIHGLAKEALETFAKMEEAKVEPNHVTLIGVLSACAHGGLVVEGRKYWSTMLESGIEPSMEHYGCMVDLFCRANQIEEAYEFVKSMPIAPNPAIWRTMLVSCKKNKMFDKGEIVADHLLQLEPLNAENYILLSSLYASGSHWVKMSIVRRQMKERGIKAVPGCSSIEINGHVHEFVMGNWSHPEAKDIRGIIWEVSERVQSVGHEPWIASVLQNVGDGEKQDALWEHSERLAIAYGLLKTKAPVIIRVVKNLRVCVDCHEVTKTISKLYDREIIVRDRIRFHKFVDGRTIGELNLGGAFNTYGE
ncbi:hypothetical protein DH2020_038933 [Rehmannia glutinosa]|uniref:DYW domain-containing protein n=1 Tax=Rehmannia glutinosa TaxID=99300 RepID=A0ABR0UYV2_REHGL